jgi:hypothetical protein
MGVGQSPMARRANRNFWMLTIVYCTHR